jgi:hypothetical protein
MENDKASFRAYVRILLSDGSGADRKGELIINPDEESPAHSPFAVGDAIDGLDVEHLRVQRDGRLPVGIDIDPVATDVAHPGMAIVRGVEPDGLLRHVNRSGGGGAKGVAVRLEQARHIGGFLMREHPQRENQ